MCQKVFCSWKLAGENTLQGRSDIHHNLIKAGLCNFGEEYKYSSAKFYETGVDGFVFLEHING